MKRKKKLFALLGVLAALCVMTLIAGQITVTPSEDDEADGSQEDAVVSVATIDAADVTHLSVESGTQTLALTSTDGEWMNAQDLDFPIDVEKVTSLLSNLEEVTASRRIDEPEALSEYGLDAPQKTVTVTLSDGSTQSFAFGNQNSLTSETYLLLNGDESAVYLVSTDLCDAFSCDPYDVIAMELIPEFETVLSLSATRGEDYAFSLVRIEDADALTYDADAIWFLKKSGATRPADTDAAEALFDNVTGLTWLSCVNAHADDADLEAYGLSGTPTVVTLVWYGEDGVEQTFTLRIGGDADGGTYAALEGSDMVYLISTSTADALRHVTYATLRSDAVCPVDFDTVSQIDIALNGEQLSVTVTPAAEATPDEPTEDSAVSDSTATEDAEGNVTAANADTAETSDTADTGDATTGTDETADGEDTAAEAEVSRLFTTADGEALDTATAESLIDALHALTATGETGTPDTDCPLIAFTFHRAEAPISTVTLTVYGFDADTCLIGTDSETCLLIAREDAEELIDLASALINPEEEEEAID